MRIITKSTVALLAWIGLTGCEELDGLLVSFESEDGEEYEEDSGWSCSPGWSQPPRES